MMRILKYSEALKKLSKEFGSDLAQQYQDNARAFVNGDNVQLDWRPLGKKKKFWLF